MFCNKKERKPNEYIFGVYHFAEWTDGDDPGEGWTVYDGKLRELFYSDTADGAAKVIGFLDKMHRDPTVK